MIPNNDLETKSEFLKQSDIDEFIERYELKHLHTDIAERTLVFVIAALGLIAALAWDDTFKQIFIKLFGSMDTIGQKLLYAAILTFVTALVTVRLNKIFKRKRRG
jgi:hypothetical protein